MKKWLKLLGCTVFVYSPRTRAWPQRWRQTWTGSRFHCRHPGLFCPWRRVCCGTWRYDRSASAPRLSTSPVPNGDKTEGRGSVNVRMRQSIVSLWFFLKWAFTHLVFLNNFWIFIWTLSFVLAFMFIVLKHF